MVRRYGEQLSAYVARRLERWLASHRSYPNKALAGRLRDVKGRLRTHEGRLRALELRTKAGELQLAASLKRLAAGEKQLARAERRVEAAKLELSRVETLLTQDDALTAEERALLDTQAIGDHLRARLAAAEMCHAPFAHLIVDDVLPPAVYELLVSAIPPDRFFSRERQGKRDFRTGTRLAPRRTKAVWDFMAQEVLPQVLRPLILERFDPLLTAHLEALVGRDAVARVRALPVRTHGHRILLRRPGYRIAPHQDPMRYYLTALLYLPHGTGDDERWGTQLFSTDQAVAATTGSIYYPEEQGIDCRLVKTAPYRRNSLFVFLNRDAVHGAEIPPAAAPPDLKRYAYAFYLGPEESALRAVVRALPEENRRAWRSRRELRSAAQPGLAARPLSAGRRAPGADPSPGP